jgi:hypothetical protein
MAAFEGPAEGAGFVTLRSARPTDALICTDRLVELAKVVGKLRFPSCTVAPETKPVPEMATEIGGPAMAVFGETEVIWGTGFSRIKETGLEMPGEGTGFSTVIEALFGDGSAMSEARIDAVNCVVLTNCVTRAILFQLTSAPPTKLVPFTVSVKAGPPRTAWLGLRELIVGSPVFTTATDTLFEVPPPGLGVDTVIGRLATGLVRLEAGTLTINCVLLM